MAGNKKDQRHAGRWLFAAVRVGTGGTASRAGTLRMHENVLKYFTFKWLPRPANAPKSGARGSECMKKALQATVHKGSFLVHDK